MTYGMTITSIATLQFMVLVCWVVVVGLPLEKLGLGGLRVVKK